MSDADIDIIRWIGAVATIVAAIIVAWGPTAKVMAGGFVLFCIAALSWVYSGIVEDKPALLLQNLVLLAINVLGVWRWSRRA